MSVLVLPALRSDDPLGFLAALGILEVLRSEMGIPEDELALGWEGVGAPALLEAPFDDVRRLASRLYEAALRIRSQGRVLAGVPAHLPPPRLAEVERKALKEEAARKGVDVPLDPLRALTRTEVIRQYRTTAGDPFGNDIRLLSGLISQTSTLPRSPYAAVTPLLALSRQQTARQVCEALLEDAVRDPEAFERALVAWKRTRGSAGANLDWRAVRDAALRTDGRSEPAAASAVEWLALQAVGWFRLGGWSGRPTAWGWLPRGEEDRSPRLRQLLWPVWRPLLDPFAVEVLLSHPDVRVAVAGSREGGRLRRMGVLAVLGSVRRREQNSDGPLGPARVLWPGGA
jgi:hypothetical protein